MSNEISQWLPVRRGAERRSLEDASLVLTAMGIENKFVRQTFDWCLVVREESATSAVRELERYNLENHGALSPQVVMPTIDSGWMGVIGFLAVIWLLPTLQAENAFGWDWLADGRMQAGLVAQGEWWRTITALTLHADIAHIVGNSLFGAVFGLFVGRYLGSGVGWLLILLAGATGNLLNAVVRPDVFSSIGASTATFAALAIGSAFVWRRGYFRGRGWRRSFAPVFAGIALLSFTGVGGGNTDVVAHFTGFAAGIAFGVVAAALRIDQLSPRGQQLCGGAAMGLLALAWMLAGGS